MKKPATPGPRFAILARVSTRDQLTGHSLAVQEKLAREYVQRAGGTVVKVYSDQESATRKEEDRAVLQRVLADADRGLFDALVIQETTRLSRNLGVMVSVMEKLVDAGIALHDFGGPLPLDTPEGEFSAHIQAVVGRFTSRQAVKKSLKSREHVLRSGGIAAGRPPFGRRWDKQTKRFEVIPKRQALMKRAYDLIVNQRGSLIRAAALLRIGSSSLRKGIRQAALTEITQHLNGEAYIFPCPPLLTVQQQQRLEMRLAANTVVRPDTKGEYLLQGLVRCFHCSATMTGQTSPKNGRSYAVYRHPILGKGKKLPEACTWQVPVELLDDDVLAACADVVKDGKALQAAVRAAITQASTGEAELAAHAADLERDATKTQKRLHRLLDSLVDFEGKGPARERLVQQVKQAETALANQRAEHADLSGRLAVIALPKGGADMIAAKLRALYWRHGAGPQAALTFAQRREFVRVIIGRKDRHSREGVYVKMIRPPGGSKKDVSWRYRIDGTVASVESHIDRDSELGPYSPDIRGRVPTPEQVRQLASIAGGSAGIRFSSMQSRNKYSSGASPPCG